MENIKKSDSNLLANIAKGTLISLISTVIMLLIFSLILAFTNVQENTINPVIMIVTAISILIGSSIANIKIRKNTIKNLRIFSPPRFLICQTKTRITLEKIKRNGKNW